jgi:hypothetical protein
MQSHVIRPGWVFWLVCVLTLPITFGIVPLALFLQMRRNWPRAVDAEGLVMHNGQRIPWKERTNVMRFPAGRYEFIFGGTTVQFPTRYIADGKKIHEEICQHLGLRWNN